MLLTMVNDKWLEQHHNLSMSLFPMNFKIVLKNFKILVEKELT
jgi:hypothetical protein